MEAFSAFLVTGEFPSQKASNAELDASLTWVNDR